MYMQQSIVKCESGLYNRQATYFIQKANEFKSSIWVEVEDRKINAKRQKALDEALIVVRNKHKQYVQNVSVYDIAMMYEKRNSFLPR